MPLENYPRTELEVLKLQGYDFNQTWEVVDIFEKKIAKYFGAPYGIATDSCTHAIELSIRLLNTNALVSIPAHTYMSIPMMLEKIKQSWQFKNVQWEKYYYLDPLPIIDAARCWESNVYVPGSLMTTSFQFKKHIPIGRGGIILTDNYEHYIKLQRMCRDGKDRKLLQQDDDIIEVGYHYYMTPEDAARGIILFDQLHNNPHRLWSWQDYKILTDYNLYKDCLVF